MNKQQLVEENLSLVYYTIKKHYPGKLNDEDIVQCGNLGLCQAADTWDESKSRFSTYAVTCIKNAITSELRTRTKHYNVLSLDYETHDSEGDTVTLGDIIPGGEDVDYVDLQPLYDRLDEQDREVLNLSRLGLRTQEISERLGISRRVVSQKLRNAKLTWRNLK